MRILILNDDTHESMYCFENCEQKNLEELLQTLAPAHTESYLWKTAYFIDTIDKYIDEHDWVNEGDAENHIEELFSALMHPSYLESKNYLKFFNELWEMAE